MQLIYIIPLFQDSKIRQTGYYYYQNMHFAVTIYYTIISKILEIRQKFKNDPIVKKAHAW